MNGGLNCVEMTSCRLCWRANSLYPNIGSIPVCTINVDHSGTILPAGVAALPAGSLAPSVFGCVQCSDETCCEGLQNPNPVTGSGYFEFDPTCANNGGGFSCVENTGCRLCANPIPGAENVGMRPTCHRFSIVGAPSPSPCPNEMCCESLQNPNYVTGFGFLEYDASCINGGLHCVGTTSCRLCWRQNTMYPNVGGIATCTINVAPVLTSPSVTAPSYTAPSYNTPTPTPVIPQAVQAPAGAPSAPSYPSYASPSYSNNIY